MLYSFLVAFFEWKIKDFSYAEIISIIFVVYSLFNKHEYKKPTSHSPFIFLAIYVSWIIFNYFLVRTQPYFINFSYLNNLIRITFYLVGLFSIIDYLKDEIHFYRLILGLRIMIGIVCVLGLIEFLFLLLNINLNFFFPYGQGLIANNGSLRPTSIFSEPAHFSIFISTSTFILMRYYHLYNQLDKIKNIIYLTLFTLLCSFSAVGYIFFLMLLLHYLNLLGKTKRHKIINIYLTLSILLVVSLVVLTQTNIFQELIVSRAEKMLSGDDGSTNQRVLGAFETIALLKKREFFTGVGLGQMAPYFTSFDFKLEHFYKGEHFGINNIIVVIILETGIIGLVLFLLFIISFTRHQFIYFLFFIILSFSWGYFNTPFFWFYIYVSYALIIHEKYRK